MAEHIEREKVNDMLNALGGCDAEPESWADGWDKAIDTAIKKLDDIPAADVRPERHGRWSPNALETEDYWAAWHECSVCRYQLDDDDYMDIFHYCPNCGAKMDGKDGK